MNPPAVSLALASAALTLASATAQAQPSPCAVRPNAVVADLGLHVVNAGYQRTLGCYVSVQASAGLYGPWVVNNNVLGLAGADHDPPGDVIGAVLRVRAFVHPFGHAPTGLWVSPFAQGGLVTAFAAGLSVGWTWRLGERWLLALGLGGQYHRVEIDGRADFPGFSRFAPTVDINVGYSF
jgi:hypothetical protein